MMPENQITYEQILEELKRKRELKPWEMVAPSSPAPAPAPTPMPAQSMTTPAQPVDDAMIQALKRKQLMEALGQLSTIANPAGEKPNPLIQMLMGLSR